VASIIKRGKKYRALIRKKGFTRCKTFQTKSAAKAWATRIEAEIDSASGGSRVPVKGWTVGELIDRYINDIKPHKQWSSGKDSSLNLLKSHMGDMPASSYGVEMVMTYAHERRREGIGSSTVMGNLSYLGVVIKYARNTLRLDLPVDAIKEARSTLADNGMLSQPRQRDRRPTQDELDLLRLYFRWSRSKIPMQDIIDFAIASGMRRGEICRIAWKDLDVEKRTVVIRDRKHPQKKIGNHQTVPLLGPAFDIVMRQPRDEKYIFPYIPQVVSEAFIRGCKRAQISDLRFHDLRHEALSRLFEQGYQIQEVALMSGHRSWDMLRRYTHIKPESLHRRIATD
jgi:integrase